MRSFSLARQLASFDHVVYLVASRSRPGVRGRVADRDGVRLIEFPDLLPSRIRNGGLSPVDWLGRSLWCAARRFDVVHAFDHRPAVALPALVARRRGAKLISDWADLWGRGGIAAERRGLGRLVGLLDADLEPRFRRRADAATVITTHLGARLEALGIPRDRQALIPPGANVDLIRPLDPREARRWAELPEDAPTIGFTGFAPYDADLLTDVITRVLLIEPRAMAVASGRLPKGLQAALQSRGIGARLHDFGVVPFASLEKVLACADVLLLPCADKEINRGRFPNRFGDYLASGRAIVTNRTGDLGAMAEQNRIAVLAPEEPEGFARDVVLLLNDVQRRAEFGERARTYAELKLSWEVLARQVEAFYFKVLAPA